MVMKLADKIEHISESDVLNDGRQKINQFAIDPALRAEKNSTDAIKIAATNNDKVSDFSKDLDALSTQVGFVKWLEPVDKLSDLPKNVEQGNQVQVLENGNVYRFDGENWVFIQNFDSINANLKYDKVDLINDFKNNKAYDYTRSYFRDALVGFRAIIDTNKINFAFATDHHYDEIGYPGGVDTYDHLANLGAISDKVEAVVLGGDNTNNDGKDGTGQTVARMISTTDDFVRRLLTVSKTDNFILKGNHDDGSNKFIYPDAVASDKTLSQIVTNADFRELYRANQNLYSENRKNGSLYFFKDYDKGNSKVRIIGLDMFDTAEVADSDGEYKYPNITYGGVRQDQLEWLTKEALICEADRHVLIFGHCPINGTIDTRATFYNHAQLKQIFEDFVNGKSNTVFSSQKDFEVALQYDFSQGNRVLAGYVCGHIHRDSYTKINGINYISCTTSCDGALAEEDEDRLTKTGTFEEEAFDVIEIDTSAKKLNFKRFGYGVDRSFDY